MFGEGMQLSYPVSLHLDRKKAVQNFVKIDASESVSVIDPTETFCNVSDGECKVRDPNGLFYFDSNHPSLYASYLIVKKVHDCLSELKW